MITLEDNRLVFRFPEIDDRATFSMEFQRTLRIPDNDRTYPLPAGLGKFPLKHLDDCASMLPLSMVRRGGVIMPMWQSEAMWINFHSLDGYPFAIKIATGKINAVTGKSWTERLQDDPQDCLVVTKQPWLDGYCVEKGIIRQFVAARLGDGVTVEEQITGVAEHGGLQIIAYPMKREIYERLFGARRHSEFVMDVATPDAYKARIAPMGLAAGGRMR